MFDHTKKCVHYIKMAQVKQEILWIDRFVLDAFWLIAGSRALLRMPVSQHKDASSRKLQFLEVTN